MTLVRTRAALPAGKLLLCLAALTGAGHGRRRPISSDESCTRLEVKRPCSGRSALLARDLPLALLDFLIRCDGSVKRGRFGLAPGGLQRLGSGQQQGAAPGAQLVHIGLL